MGIHTIFFPLDKTLKKKRGKCKSIINKSVFVILQIMIAYVIIQFCEAWFKNNIIDLWRERGILDT